MSKIFILHLLHLYIIIITVRVVFVQRVAQPNKGDETTAVLLPYKVVESAFDPLDLYDVEFHWSFVRVAVCSACPLP